VTDPTQLEPPFEPCTTYVHVFLEFIENAPPEEVRAFIARGIDLSREYVTYRDPYLNCQVYRQTTRY